MYFAKSFVVLAAVTALASATPAVEQRDESDLFQRQWRTRDNCKLESCYKNGCEGMFTNPYDTVGTCAAGKWRGCPCEKCSSTKCVKNGCEGYQGKCTAGKYQGCPCK